LVAGGLVVGKLVGGRLLAGHFTKNQKPVHQKPSTSTPETINQYTKSLGSRCGGASKLATLQPGDRVEALKCYNQST
jgi:hypothetical protein